jgi:uncharacterized protein YbaP (TraB family)
VRAIFLLACFTACASGMLRAQDPAPPAAPTTTLDSVLVVGEQPGPGLWKISKDDHILWILGTLSPLPKKMTWRSQQVESIVAQSQQVLAVPTASLQIGFFRSLTLVPSLLHARKNENGAKLQDVLEPDLYTRWLALKAKYIGRSNSVERLRPMLAARELYEKAIDKSGLTNDRDAWRVVERAARKARVPISTPTADIPVDDPKAAIKDFESTSPDLDAACLATTIQRLETDLGSMRQRANAWATGDMDALRSLPYPDQRAACLTAVSSTPRVHDLIEEARSRIAQAWLAAAEKSLNDNLSTLAVLPMAELVAPAGPLDALRAKGYTIEDPQ